MTGHIPYLQQRWRAWLLARWQRRWRLTRRGRLVFGSLGVLLLLVISPLVGSWARDAPPAKGLPATTSRPEEPSRRAARATSRGFTLIASGDVLTHGPVWRQAGAYGRRGNQPYDFRPMFTDIRPLVAGAARCGFSALWVTAGGRALNRHSTGAGTDRSAARHVELDPPHQHVEIP